VAAVRLNQRQHKPLRHLLSTRPAQALTILCQTEASTTIYPS